MSNNTNSRFKKGKKGPPDEAPDKAPGEESDEAPKFENANQRFAASLISEPAQLTAFVGRLLMWAFFYLLSPPAVAFKL